MLFCPLIFHSYQNTLESYWGVCTLFPLFYATKSSSLWVYHDFYLTQHIATIGMYSLDFDGEAKSFLQMFQSVLLSVCLK